MPSAAESGSAPEEPEPTPATPERSERGDETARFTVSRDGAGLRLDHLLTRLLDGPSRAALQRWIREGRVEVRLPEADAPLTRVLPRWKAVLGARLIVSVPPDRPFALEPEALGVRVLFCDSDLVVISKPAGMVSHPSPGHRGGSVVNALLHSHGPLPDSDSPERPGIVHRLDRETSGAMVVARTRFALDRLSAQFHSRETEKVYLAICRGRPKEDRFSVDAAIGRSRHDRKKMACRPDGRSAETRFEVLERFSAHALVRCRPVTGRTHQIRLHLHLRHLPILCDALYAPERDVTRTALSGGRAPRCEQPLLTRHALHAHALTIAHPRTGERLRFEAPLPEDLQRVLAVLRGEGG